MALTPGTKLGPYEIQSPLGAGGMGEVYRARDTRLGRDVAIKVLPAHLSANPDLRQRLDREAKAISSLNHPHICTLYDVGSQDGVDFLVMEHLEGETLADRLHRGAMPLAEALKTATEIADALAKAHARGIVHRDLKPANIMLAKNGPKLMDFGLAKPAPGLSSASGAGLMTPTTPTMSVAALSGTASPLTEKGTVVGTFQYMAPEVLQGAEADARSDIFSFGCVLYEMFTGRRAFEGKSQFSVLGAILDKEPDRISTVMPSSPPRLDETVLRCLAKNPGQRYGCMHDVAIQLQALKEASPEAAVTSADSSKPVLGGSRLAWIVAGIATLIALGIGAAYVFQTPKPAAVVRSSILPPPGATFLLMAVESGPPVLSPDGTRLAFTARDDKGKVMMYVRALNSAIPRALPGTDDAMYPLWSPDSREIGFFASGKLRRVNAEGGPPQTVCDASNGRGGAWSKDGVILFTPTTSSNLMRVPATGGTPEPASRLDSAKGENSHRWPFFLPDGKHFLFWARTSQGLQGNTLYAGELGSLNAKELMKSESMAEYASGYLLFMREATLMARPFNPRTLQVTGESVPIAEHIAINGGVTRPIFSVSENGSMIYESGDTAGTWNLKWMSREGKPLDAIAEPDRYFYPALSPDGTRLAVNLFNGTQGTQAIWIFDLARGTKTRLTFGASSQVSPAWSPDGKTIFYHSNALGGFHLYSKAADGSGSDQVVLDSKDGEEGGVRPSPDGRYLVFLRRTPSQPVLDLWVLPLFGDRKPFPLVQTAFVKTTPAVSPDGKWLAYSSNESGRSEVYITAFPGGGAKWQVSTSGGSAAHWRRDGKELFFLDTTDNIVAVDVNLSGTAPQLGVPHVLFQASAIQRQNGPFDVTADGKKFLVNVGNLKEGSDPLTLVLNWTADLKK
ncbi:MAG TPA: protein kinase [Candidatus Sulfotelmatobacter sp.]|nr:protein kinase [Candidatus Sulfotelmatobacter sp.]